MGKITLTPEEDARLKANDSLILPLPGAKRNGTATFHNPVTGKEIFNQPIDPYHLMRRLRQGWQLGPSSPELKEKWIIREAELKVEDDRMVAEHVATHGHVEPDKDQFNEAVTAAVTTILEQLGHPLPVGAERTTRPAPVGEEKEPEGRQLPLFEVPADAPSKSDTKHVVSQAFRPALQLVDLRKE